MNVRLLHWALFVWFSTCAFGQNPPSTTSPASAKPVVSTGSAPSTDYSGEPSVVEHLDSVYTMAAEGTGVKVTTASARVQSEAALKQDGVLNLPFTSNTQTPVIVYVRVRHADGTVVATPVDQAIEMPSPVTQAAPFYSDLKMLQLPVRNLRVGDTLEWQAKIILKKADAAGQFWGQESFSVDGVVLSQTLELRVPKDIYVNVWSPTNKPTETVDGGERVYRWISSQKKPTVGKEADAEKELKKKQVLTAEQELDATDGKLPDVAWTTFKNWEAVGAWYRGLESDRMAPDPEIKAKVTELVAGKTTEEEKVRAVYAYVSSQIRYIGVAFGIGRYQPHQASDVLQNQYGDCKDKHTLLAAMLNSLGLHPDAVLIGAGVRFNEAVPSPSSFNHLITTVPVNGQQIWLDATAEVAPYRALAYVIRDKKALVVPETGLAKIEQTPATLPFPSMQKMNAVGTLDAEGTSNSKLVLTLRGDDEMAVRAALRQISPAQYSQFVQQLSHGMGYEGTTSEGEVSRLDDTVDPLTISYDYKREKGGDWNNLQIVPQLAPVYLPQLNDKEPPVQSIVLGVPRVETSTAAMKLPDGWGVELPEEIHQKSAYATYDETYRFEKGTIYTERRIEVLKQKVPVSDWKSYKKWADDADLAHDQWIKLVRPTDKNEAKVENTTTPPIEGTPDAARLVEDAHTALEMHTFDRAQSLLDQAKQLDSKRSFLWENYGDLEMAQGKTLAAIDSYREELSLYPDHYETYEQLVSAQTKAGLGDDAKQTLRKWTAAEPHNPLPHSRLARLLLKDSDAEGAAAIAESGIRGLPEGKQDEVLELLLGRAQLMAGKTDQGRATLLVLMQTTKSPKMMNDSAYELADAKLELPLAEAAARTALDKMADESKRWTLDRGLQILKANSRQIVATWDTLGWILYQEGKIDEAEPYLKAAWMNRQSETIAKHLGQLCEATGKKDKALTVFEIGLATIPLRNSSTAKKVPGIEEQEMQSRIDALRKNGAKSASLNVETTLQAMRTFSLGPSKGVDDVAEYYLLVNKEKIVGTAPTWGKELPDGDSKLKMARLTAFTPPNYEANLVRSGKLNCHSGVCELVLEP
jgi:tetratricopeptide (TPR) repeat protein